MRDRARLRRGLREGIRRALAFYADIALELGGNVADLHKRLGRYIAEARTHAPVRLAELHDWLATTACSGGRWRFAIETFYSSRGSDIYRDSLPCR